MSEAQCAELTTRLNRIRDRTISLGNQIDRLRKTHPPLPKAPPEDDPEEGEPAPK